MKVNRCLVMFVLALMLLAMRNGAVAGQVPPPRPAFSFSFPEEVVPAWALSAPPLSPSSAPPSVSVDTVGAGLRPAPTVEPELLRALLEAEPDKFFRVIVHLREQADLKAAVGGALGAAEARSRVVSALQATATRSQRPLRAYLEGARAAGTVQSYMPFWIVNGIAVHTNRDTVFALTARPEISTVRLDHWRQWIAAEIPNPQFAIRDLQSTIEWGITRIRADEVWSALHISGTGAVVAGMDTGGDWLHPALQANYRGYNPHSGPSNHTYSWHDATDGGAEYAESHGNPVVVLAIYNGSPRLRDSRVRCLALLAFFSFLIITSRSRLLGR